jgi:hypothetical protein
LGVNSPVRPKNGFPESPLGSEAPYGNMNMQHFTANFDTHLKQIKVEYIFFSSILLKPHGFIHAYTES